ncbi:hypothetical protein CCP3SC15_2840004 [Gammaproteobacteria bacterium]
MRFQTPHRDTQRGGDLTGGIADGDDQVQSGGQGRCPFQAVKEIQLREDAAEGIVSALNFYVIIHELNPILREWFEYFKHAVHWELKAVDQFVRRRLRVMLLHRKRKRGKGKSLMAHRLWPNVYTERGHSLQF